MNLPNASSSKRLFETLSRAPLPEWPRVEAASQALELAAGATLFQVEEVQPYIYGVRSGLIKQVLVGPEGRECVKGLSYEQTFFTSVAALQPQGRTSFAAVAVEDSVVERLEFRVLLQLADTHPSWQRLLRQAFQTFSARKELREREVLMLTDEQRVRSFVHEHPALEGRVPAADLASYLGMTPDALARVQARLRRGG